MNTYWFIPKSCLLKVQEDVPSCMKTRFPFITSVVWTPTSCHAPFHMASSSAMSSCTVCVHTPHVKWLQFRFSAKWPHLHKAGKLVVFYWVPGHTGLPGGNEAADVAQQEELISEWVQAVMFKPNFLCCTLILHIQLWWNWWNHPFSLPSAPTHMRKSCSHVFRLVKIHLKYCHMSVTRHGIWIDNWIYWTLTTHNYKWL
jgi:hypothetical protein